MTNNLTFPPGNAGVIAQFIYGAAPRPVIEVAVVGAIGLLAGICGLQWQVSRTGLNVYIILVARSAIGKEALHSGISMLLNAILAKEPNAMDCVDFTIMASGQALTKTCMEKPCFVNLTGEIGHVFACMAHSKPGDQWSTLKRALLDLYSKSGASAIASGITYSDPTNNIDSPGAVAYSLVGDTTPGTFYDSITNSTMDDGFMSRFTIVQYHGDRPEKNTARCEPNRDLVEALAGIVGHARVLSTRKTTQLVELDGEAEGIFDQFNTECDKGIRANADEAKRQVWNRAHLKALRIAALLAVADNYLKPVIATHHAIWAIDLIRRDIGTFITRLDGGDLGDSDATRKSKVTSILLEYLHNPPEKYHAMRAVGLAPDQYLQTRTQNVAAFSKHPLGANKALRLTIEALIHAGVLTKASPSLVTQLIPKARGTCYLMSGLPGYEQDLTPAA